jgi:hypothetical protein
MTPSSGFQLGVYHMTDIHSRPNAAMSRFTLLAKKRLLPANLPNRSAFPGLPASIRRRTKNALHPRLLWYRQTDIFSDARDDVLTSIGAAHDDTLGINPAYFDVVCPKCRYTLIVDIQKEQIPRRHHWSSRMVFGELLKEETFLLRRTPDGNRRKGLSKHN